MILHLSFNNYICVLKNLYKILNVDFQATTAEVKSAYRRLALLYHPDKTDNELLKARFAEVKEAYEVLSDPARRKQYDLTFDNFSYRKQADLTPLQLLNKAKELRSKTRRMDPHRMDLDRLEFEITELLSERNTNSLSRSEDRDIVNQFIEELLEAARPLTPEQLRPIHDQLLPFANSATREKMKSFARSHYIDNRWNRYKILLAIAGAIALCVLIYLIGI